MLVPGATDVQDQARGFGEYQVTYQAPGAPYAWYFAIVRNLSAEGWAGPIDTRAGLRNTPEVHWHIVSFGFLYIAEEVALQGDPNFARITVRRTIIIPWRRYIP